MKNDYKYGFSDPEKYIRKIKGLSEKTVKEISRIKNEPAWMRKIRLRSLRIFLKTPLPKWAADLSGINFSEFFYYIKSAEKKAENWEDVPENIRKTFQKLGIPEAEQKFLAGAGAQYESEAVYHNIREDLKKKGVIFLDMDSGLKEHSDIVKEYFASVVPLEDNKFSALNTAFWSGGSFVHVPKNVKIGMPLQAYFRINAKHMGQFERTLIIAEQGSFVHYTEGCTAPTYTTDALHAAVVEVIAMPESRIRYTTIQNWSNNVYNLVTKRAFVYENAIMEWVDGNIGSKINMKYPSSILKGRGAKAELLSLTIAGKGQIQDSGGKMIHLAPETSSRIISKSVCKDGGSTVFRGLVRIAPKAKNSRTHVKCDSLMLDEKSKAHTIPTMQIEGDVEEATHEARVGKVDADQLFYLMSRGISKNDAIGMLVNGFIEPIVKELPLEYAIELNRLIQLEMEGAVG